MSLTDLQTQTPASSTLVQSKSDDLAIQRQKRKQSEEAIKDIAFGSIAGICGKIFEYPFDTIKVRLQSQPSTTKTLANGQTYGSGLYYNGPLDCFRKSVAAGGIKSLYRGISAPLFGAAVETSSIFFCYRIAQEVICTVAYPEYKTENSASGKKPPLPLTALLFCGGASGAFTSLLLTPIELVKCQMQAGTSTSQGNVHKNPLSVIASVWRNHGLLGFWRGQMATLIRETGGSAAWFGSYEGAGALLKEWTLSRSDAHAQSDSSRESFQTPVWHQLLAGATAGVSYNFLFYPADTIKSRMQTEQVVELESLTGRNIPAVQQRAGFWSVGGELWREQGLKGMYRGCGLTVARSAPASAIIFAIFEALRGRFA